MKQSYTPKERVWQGELPKELRSKASSEQKKALSDTFQATEQGFLQKLEKNPEFKQQGDITIIKLSKQGGVIPVAFNQSEQGSIAAVQEFDPSTPTNQEVIAHAENIIEDAKVKGYIDDDIADPNYVQFCIYAANRAIAEKRQGQDDVASATITQDAIENNGGVVTQKKVEAAGAQVCKDFAPLFSTILEQRNVGDTHIVCSLSEEHMYTFVDIPGHGIERVDAKKNPEIVDNNPSVQLYEQFGKKSHLN